MVEGNCFCCQQMASTPESTLHTRRRAASSRSGLGRELSYLNFLDCLCLAGAWNVFLWVSSMWVNSNCKISSVLCGKATVFQHPRVQKVFNTKFSHDKSPFTIVVLCLVYKLIQSLHTLDMLCTYNTRWKKL